MGKVVSFEHLIFTNFIGIPSTKQKVHGFNPNCGALVAGGNPSDQFFSA